MDHAGVDTNGITVIYFICTTVIHQEESVRKTKPQLKIRLDHDVKAWLERKAKSDERPQCWLINKALKNAMERDQAREAETA